MATLTLDRKTELRSLADLLVGTPVAERADELKDLDLPAEEEEFLIATLKARSGITPTEFDPLIARERRLLPGGTGTQAAIAGAAERNIAASQPLDFGATTAAGNVAQDITNILMSPGRAAVRAGGELGDFIAQDIPSFFLDPVDQPVSSTPEPGIQLPLDFGQSQRTVSGPGFRGAGGVGNKLFSQNFNLGPRIPVPQQEAPVAPDFSRVRQLLEEARPEVRPPNENLELLSVLQGLTAGAAGATTEGIGPALLKAGAGGLTGLLQSRQAQEQAELEQEARLREFATTQAGLELQFAEIEAQTANQAREVQFNNALQVFNEDRARVSFPGQGIIAVRSTNPDGTENLKVEDLGLHAADVNMRLAIASITGQKHAGPQTQSLSPTTNLAKFLLEDEALLIQALGPAGVEALRERSEETILRLDQAGGIGTKNRRDEVMRARMEALMEILFDPEIGPGVQERAVRALQAEGQL